MVVPPKTDLMWLVFCNKIFFYLKNHYGPHPTSFFVHETQWDWQFFHICSKTQNEPESSHLAHRCTLFESRLSDWVSQCTNCIRKHSGQGLPTQATQPFVLRSPPKRQSFSPRFWTPQGIRVAIPTSKLNSTYFPNVTPLFMSPFVIALPSDSNRAAQEGDAPTSTRRLYPFFFSFFVVMNGRGGERQVR